MNSSVMLSLRVTTSVRLSRRKTRSMASESSPKTLVCMSKHLRGRLGAAERAYSDARTSISVVGLAKLWEKTGTNRFERICKLTYLVQVVCRLLDDEFSETRPWEDWVGVVAEDGVAPEYESL
jgi:hypothetical protein